MKLFKVFAVSAILLTFTFNAAAAIPRTINFQGLLTGTGGSPLKDSTYSVTFTIYDMSSGGTNLWTEDQNVTTSDGLFTVKLGAVTLISESIFSDSSRFVGIKVNPNAEFSPRTKLVSSAFSFRVGTIDGATGGNISGKVSLGDQNVNSGAYAISIGLQDTASGNYSTVSGGTQSAAIGSYAMVGGGFRNRAVGDQSVIGGGTNNNASQSASTVGGGGYNSASNFNATVGGGFADTASGDRSTIGGGSHNKASGQTSTIAGGRDHTASHTDATVGGGYFNKATGQHSVVAGGYNNIAGQLGAAVSGGSSDTATGFGATVPGGYGNKAQGDYSFAAGRLAKANHIGSFVWSDDQGTNFVSTGDNQFLIRAVGGVGIGTNSPGAGLHVKGANFPKSFGFFDTDAVSQDAGLRFYEAGAVKSHLFHEAGTNVLNLYGEGYSGVSITSLGMVGIGTNAPSHPLQMGSGAHCTAGGTWTNASSRELKFDIEPLENEEYSRILKELDDLEVVRFRYKTEPDVEHIGMIAEEVPDEIASPDRKGIPTADAIAFLMAAVKAQQTQIKNQQNQIEDLKSTISRISKGK